MDLRLRLVTVALALGLGGCSFAFVHGPPAGHQQMRFFDCSTSNILPFVDTLVAAGAVGETLDATTGSGAFNTSKAAIATFAVEAAVFGASAVYGFKKTSDCRDAQTALLMRTPPVPAGPYLFAPPPPPVDPWTGRPVTSPPPPPPAPETDR